MAQLVCYSLCLGMRDTVSRMPAVHRVQPIMQDSRQVLGDSIYWIVEWSPEMRSAKKSYSLTRLYHLQGGAHERLNSRLKVLDSIRAHIERMAATSIIMTAGGARQPSGNTSKVITSFMRPRQQETTQLTTRLYCYSFLNYGYGY